MTFVLARPSLLGDLFGGPVRAFLTGLMLLLDPKLQIYGPSGKLVVADAYDRKKWALANISIRRWMDATKLAQKPIYAILSGKGVRPQTMATFRTGAGSLGV